MDKNLSRSIRRHHIERLKKTRRAYWGYRSGYNQEAMPEKQLGKVVQHPQICSCMGCGNPRKWFKELTMQERRHLDMGKIKD